MIDGSLVWVVGLDGDTIPHDWQTRAMFDHLQPLHQQEQTEVVQSLVVVEDDYQVVLHKH